MSRAGIGGIGGELAKEFHAKGEQWSWALLCSALLCFASRADAERLGFRVFATARRLETVQELQDTLGIEIIQLDPTGETDVRRVRDEVALRTGGKLDVLVNNAFGHLYPSIHYGC